MSACFPTLIPAALSQSIGAKRTDYIIQNWLRNRNTIEFLGIWEQLNNPDFNPYGGTYAHQDIAFEFASWVSVEFKLYLIKEFQRLKEDENRRLSLAWDLSRTLSKLNYRIHTDAVKTNLIPAVVSAAQAASTYASEADLRLCVLRICGNRHPDQLGSRE